jgi:hypothetical protein
MELANDWSDVLRRPADGDHIVHTWQDESFLAETVTKYLGAALASGAAALVVATPAHFELFKSRLADSRSAGRTGQLRFLDAEDTLAKFMRNGVPDWTRFHEAVGGLIAQLRLQYPEVRAYGEMVDVLWQRGERDAAIRLEEFWNQLARLQTFSLFCAYRMDHLDGQLECICKTHTHLIPVRDYDLFNEAVTEASHEVLDRSLAQMLLSITANQRPATEMPVGQAILMWLQKHMPRTAEKVLAGVRQRYPAEA